MDRPCTGAVVGVASPWQCAFGIRVPTVPYPLERPDAAVRDLAHDRITGAAVVRVARV